MYLRLIPEISHRPRPFAAAEEVGFSARTN